ncbi:MAG TPA: hypothetical protein VFC14_24970 [Burkholderiales bacterium]|nr:hypothetical protein [Burkholderiales bacterium]
MRLRNHLVPAGLLATALLLASCGGGGGYSGDVVPGAPVPLLPAALSTPDNFLIFPNPQVQPDGSFQTLSTVYTQAYYAAIDPANSKDTLDKWKTANGFGSGTGTEVTVVFGDVRDLGYGRRMTARQNVDGTVAVMVENYLVASNAGYSYTTLNLDAAVVRDTRWHLATNAIEFSPGPGGGASFVKFFTFDAATGARSLTADMDGRGPKAMPGPCLTCHGGRGDPLTPPDATGRQLFPLVRNTTTANRGDTRAHMHALEVDGFDYSTTAGFTRADQEAALKIINRMVLCTYPLPAPTGSPEDACRPALNPNNNEWPGTAAAIIKNAYGGPGLPNATFSDTYLPATWLGAGQTSLYQGVVAPTCRTCHIMRGTVNQQDIDFDQFARFQGYADRTKAHVVDRGNMPLAKLVFDRYHASTAPELMATFLESQGFAVRDGSGAPLRPGRPVADPGPNRAIPPGAATLSAAGSLFSNTFQWSIVAGPAGATLTNASSAQATFTAATLGTYVVQLVASNGAVQSAPAQLTIVVTAGLPIAPAAIRFSDIKTALQLGAGGCAGCHFNGNNTPVTYDDIDRNGDGIIGDATDDLWLYTEVRGLINFTDIVASPLLRKPSGQHHNGGMRPSFDISAAPPGDPARAGYDLFLNWILNNAPR